MKELKYVETCSGCYCSWYDSDPRCVGCNPELLEKRAKEEATKLHPMGSDE